MSQGGELGPLSISNNYPNTHGGDHSTNQAVPAEFYDFYF